MDFGGREGVLETVRKYIKDPEARSAIASGELQVRFLEYDWSVNAAV